jgi:hypothetical protein
MDEEEKGKLVWNFDDAESRLIFEMKVDFINKIKIWDLEGSYWALSLMLSEINPLFDEDIREELKGEIGKITKARKDTDKFTILDEDEKGTVWKSLNDFYERLCIEMVEQDYYYRKKKEYVGY